MANLVFDFRNYSFNRALDILIGGFSGSFAAMNEQLLAAHDAMVRHDQFLADGGDDGAVYEEEDGPDRAFFTIPPCCSTASTRTQRYRPAQSARHL